MKFTEDEIKNIHTLCDSVKDMDYSVGRWFGAENPVAIAKIVDRRGDMVYCDVTDINPFFGKRESKRFRGYKIGEFSASFHTAFSNGDEAYRWFERKTKAKDSKVNDIVYSVGRFYGGRNMFSGKPELIKPIHIESQWYRLQLYTFDDKTNSITKKYTMYDLHALQKHYPHAFNTAEEGLAWLKRIGMSERR